MEAMDLDKAGISLNGYTRSGRTRKNRKDYTAIMKVIRPQVQSDVDACRAISAVFGIRYSAVRHTMIRHRLIKPIKLQGFRRISKPSQRATTPKSPAPKLHLSLKSPKAERAEIDELYCHLDKINDILAWAKDLRPAVREFLAERLVDMI